MYPKDVDAANLRYPISGRMPNGARFAIPTTADENGIEVICVRDDGEGKKVSGVGTR